MEVAFPPQSVTTTGYSSMQSPSFFGGSGLLLVRAHHARQWPVLGAGGHEQAGNAAPVRLSKSAALLNGYSQAVWHFGGYTGERLRDHCRGADRLKDWQ